MRNLSIHINAYDLSKIMHWVHQAGKFEVSGFGKILKYPWGFEVANPLLLEQENTRGNTEILPRSLGRAIYETEKEPGDFAWWWHSHPFGRLFFSDEDRTAIRQYARGGYLVATVFVPSGESHSALCVDDGKYQLFVEGINVTTHYPVEKEVEDQLKAEYEAKVKNFDTKKIKGKWTLVPAESTNGERAYD